MIQLERFFANPFDTRDISDDNLKKFSEDGLRRLSAAFGAGGDPEGILAATAVAHDGYFGALTDEDTKTAVRKALTLSMNGGMEEFQRTVSRRAGTIRSEFGIESPQYAEFFPGGLTEYSNATLASVEKLMSRMATTATKYKDTLGKPFVERFSGLLKQFKAARAAQLEGKGDVSTSNTLTKEKRDALPLQLFDNLLVLARRHKDEPDRAADYFDQSIIRRPNTPAQPPAPKPAPATAGAA